MKQRIAYQPGQSFLHHLHPLVKGAWLVFVTAFVFVVHHPLAVLGAIALLLLAAWLAKLRLHDLRGTRLFVTTALLLGVLQVVFVHTGTVVAAVMKRVRRDLDNVPFLNMAYDGLEQTNTVTRLEAFMHQAAQYAKRKRGEKQAEMKAAA